MRFSSSNLTHWEHKNWKSCRYNDHWTSQSQALSVERQNSSFQPTKFHFLIWMLCCFTSPSFLLRIIAMPLLPIAERMCHALLRRHPHPMPVAVAEAATVDSSSSEGWQIVGEDVFRNQASHDDLAEELGPSVSEAPVVLGPLPWIWKSQAHGFPDIHEYQTVGHQVHSPHAAHETHLVTWCKI